MKFLFASLIYQSLHRIPPFLGRRAVSFSIVVVIVGNALFFRFIFLHLFCFVLVVFFVPHWARNQINKKKETDFN